MPKLSDRALIIAAMATTCDICGKGYLRGNQVARGIGDRVSRRTIRKQLPNLRTVRMALNGGSKTTLYICTSCLKRMKKEKKDVAAEVIATDSKTTAAK